MTIPIPPLPQWPEALAGNALYFAAGGATLLGLVLLLWGRTLGRTFLVLVGAGIGYLAGEPLANLLNAPPLLGQIAAGLTLAVIFLLAARLIWALSISSLFEAIATIALVLHFLPVLGDIKGIRFAAAASFVEWAASLYQFCFQGFVAVMQGRIGTVMLIVVPAGLLPLILALAKPRLGVIVLTGLLGGTLTTAALWALAVRIRPMLWPDTWLYFLIPAGVAMVMTLIGWIYQGSGELAKAKAKAEEKKKADESAKPPKKDEDKVYLPKAPNNAKK